VQLKRKITRQSQVRGNKEKKENFIHGKGKGQRTTEVSKYVLKKTMNSPFMHEGMVEGIYLTILRTPHIKAC